MKQETLFHNILLKDVERFVHDGKEENISLDFKTVSEGSLKSKADKKNFARSLSGFANSSGGLIIWGVDARKNEDGVDCAKELKPINDIDLFLSRLNELEGEAVSPIIDGVLHKKIESKKNSGYAVTLVPESISGPHMAKLGENRYYKRSGDSFYTMEHFDLEDMFGRRKKPKLDLSTRITGKGNQTKIYLGIENSGRGSAKAPYLAFIVPPPFTLNPYGIDGNNNEGLPRLLERGGGPWVRFGGNALYVVHPNTKYEVASIYLGLGSSGPEPPAKGIEIEYELIAEDSSLISGKRKITFT